MKCYLTDVDYLTCIYNYWNKNCKFKSLTIDFYRLWRLHLHLILNKTNIGKINLYT